MKAIVLRSPGGLDRLELIEMPDPGPLGPGEIRVRLRASSLNYHDYLVATGRIRTADGRIPMSDGAGVVEAVGDASCAPSSKQTTFAPPSRSKSRSF